MSAERRRYYRIDDEVMLSLARIDAAELDQRLDDFWSNEHEFSIRNNYNFQISQHIADRIKIENKMPELGRYLAVLEKQIDLLTEKLLEDKDALSMQKKSANLSAQGISYQDENAPPQDDLIEIRLKLLPSGLRLVIIARVVMIESATGHDQGGHKVSLDFENLHEADREILIKHIHGKQMESLSKSQES